MPTLKLSRALPFVAATLVIGLAVANMLRWYLLGGAFVISDDAEFWNWGVRYFDRGQAFPHGIDELRALLGGRGTALPLFGPSLLLAFGGSVRAAERFYSCGCLAAFLTAGFAVGRSLGLGTVGALLFLGCLAGDPFLMKGFECFFSEPPYLVGLLAGLALVLRGRPLAAAFAIGVAAWFRPFETFRVAGVGALAWFLLEALRQREGRREALVAAAAVAGSLLLFRISANVELLRFLFAVPCLMALPKAGGQREPLRAVTAGLLCLTAWLVVAGDVVWNWVAASSGTVGGTAWNSFTPERLVSAARYDGLVAVRFLGAGGIAMAVVAAVLVGRRAWAARDLGVAAPWLAGAAAWAFAATLAGLAPLRESAMAVSRFFMGEYLLFFALGFFALARASRRAAFAMLTLVLASNAVGVYLAQYDRSYPPQVTQWLRGFEELGFFGENTVVRSVCEAVGQGERAEEPLRMLFVTKDANPWLEDQSNIWFVDRGTKWRVLSGTRGPVVIYPLAQPISLGWLRQKYPGVTRFYVANDVALSGTTPTPARVFEAGGYRFRTFPVAAAP